jgi:hypothetical protein
VPPRSAGNTRLQEPVVLQYDDFKIDCSYVALMRNTSANRLRIPNRPATLVLPLNEAATETAARKASWIQRVGINDKKLKQLLRSGHQFARVVDGSRR